MNAFFKLKGMVFTQEHGCKLKPEKIENTELNCQKLSSTTMGSEIMPSFFDLHRQNDYSIH